MISNEGPYNDPCRAKKSEQANIRICSNWYVFIFDCTESCLGWREAATAGCLVAGWECFTPEMLNCPILCLSVLTTKPRLCCVSAKQKKAGQRAVFVLQPGSIYACNMKCWMFCHKYCMSLKDQIYVSVALVFFVTSRYTFVLLGLMSLKAFGRIEMIS